MPVASNFKYSVLSTYTYSTFKSWMHCNIIDTNQKFWMCDEINCQEKCLRICHILYRYLSIWKLKVAFSIFCFQYVYLRHGKFLSVSQDKYIISSHIHNFWRVFSLLSLCMQAQYTWTKKSREFSKLQKNLKNSIHRPGSSTF